MTMKRWLIFLFLALTPLAWALPKEGSQQPFVDLSGVWVLDKGASESMDAMMAAEGISTLERRVYAHLGVTLKIHQTPALVTINMITSVITELEELKTDGSPQPREVFHVGKVTTRTTWADGGRSLRTVTDLKAGDGTPAQGIVNRSLEDNGQTLVQQLTLVLQDGTTIPVKRVYRRKK